MAHKIALTLAVGLSAPVLAETVLGVTVFTRHGDRSSKHYKGYSLTNLGFQQNHQVGIDYRETYLLANSSKQILGISEDKYVSSQIYASAPDQLVLSNTATAFLQGLYPPLAESNAGIASATLNDGTQLTSPLNGYQYVLLQAKSENSPDTIWIKGDDLCPAYTKAANTFEDSVVFQERVDATKDFYSQFWSILDDVYDYKQENMTYENAYDIFDLINTARIHNTSSPALEVTDDQLFQLRTLADSAEFGLNWNASQEARSVGGRTLMGGILNQLNQTVTSKGKVKFSLLAGSYDTFLAFFGVSDLISVDPNFYGLPDYASSMAFEILTENDVEAFPSSVDDLRVRFLFRNGSSPDSALTAFPLFGRNQDTLPWSVFVQEMQDRGVTTLQDWCSTCASTQNFCATYPGNPAYEALSQKIAAAGHANDDESSSASSSSSGGMSNAVAGVIGAMVTLGVVGVLGLAGFLVMRKKRTTPASAVASSESAAEKGSLSS